MARSQADVWRLCAHLVEPASADDLTQEVYLRAHPGTGLVPGRRVGPLVAALDRPEHLHGRAAPPDARAGPWSNACAAGPTRAPTVEPDRSGLVEIDEAVRSLDPDRRDAFVLTQVLGLSYAETAEVCGCEIGTIRSRVARARGQLIELLVDDGPASGSGSASG